MPKKPRGIALLWGAAIVLVGGFFFWLQVGLVASFGALAWSGYGLQSNLSGAAQGLINGDYERGEADFELADQSTALMLKSVDTTQVRFMGAVPGISAAVQNWRNSVAAAANISAPPVSSLTCKGRPSGKS